ncbi:MAG: flavin reductase family protein [Promethearchaeota archaeon]
MCKLEKVKTGMDLPLLPLPVCIIGAHVDGKPNFNTIVWFNMLNSPPSQIGVAMSKRHYTNKGIKENREFSLNLPSVDMVEVTDYVGLHSGSEIDKSEIFNIFYGELKKAPMIENCPLNIECKLVKIIDFERTELFVGEIVEVYTEEKYLTESKADFNKMDLFIFLMPEGPYLRVGEYLAKAYDIGNSYKPK